MKLICLVIKGRVQRQCTMVEMINQIESSKSFSRPQPILPGVNKFTNGPLHSANSAAATTLSEVLKTTKPLNLWSNWPFSPRATISDNAGVEESNGRHTNWLASV